MLRMHKKRPGKFVIGIDIGGTNADAALYDCALKQICAQGKVPTDHTDYQRTLQDLLSSMSAHFPRDLQDIVAVNLSTTLSTNAILEGKGAPVNLVLIGFEKQERLISEIMDVIRPASLISIPGGHTSWGEERGEFDEAALRSCLSGHSRERFAVSGMFSPRNPAHEICAANIIQNEFDGVVSCGYELARSKLNAVKRTVTAYLNASLIPLIERFIDDAEKTVSSFGLTCPVMFLKSDSTLVSSRWCRKYPIETIFSGPAASMRGACHLVGAVNTRGLVVADIGGTSTDIGCVQDGSPVFSNEGASVGTYRTMVPSLEIRSIALGGDSEVKVSERGGLQIGPCRVVPFCRSGGKFLETGITCTEDYGYTPTDAINTLGKASINNVSLSKEASEWFGGVAGLHAEKFAERVWEKTTEKLETNIIEVIGWNKQYTRVYVGAPGAVFADAAAEKNVARIDAEDARVASAIGAATSAVELKCEATIVHSFEDETYTAFLPHAKLQGKDLELLLEQTERAIIEYLTKQAKLMGEADGHVKLARSYMYLTKKRVSDVVNSVTILAEFSPFSLEI